MGNMESLIVCKRMESSTTRLLLPLKGYTGTDYPNGRFLIADAQTEWENVCSFLYNTPKTQVMSPFSIRPSTSFF